MNPQNSSGLGLSLVGSGALPKEFRDEILVETERIEITRRIDPTLDDKERDNHAFNDRDTSVVIAFNRAVWDTTIIIVVMFVVVVTIWDQDIGMALLDVLPNLVEVLVWLFAGAIIGALLLQLVDEL